MRLFVLYFNYITLTAITQECWEQYWTSPGVNTPQNTNYMATCLPPRKLYKLDEPDTQDTAGEARMNSSVMYSYGPRIWPEDLPKAMNDREK